MPSSFDAADSTTTDRRAWLETFLEPASEDQAASAAPHQKTRTRYSPRIGTVLGLYLVALLGTGSVANTGLPAFLEVTAADAALAMSSMPSSAALPGPVTLARSAAIRIPMRSRMTIANAAAVMSETAARTPEATDNHMLSGPEPKAVTTSIRTVSIDPGDFQGLLEPAGIGRRFWRSFNHVPPYTGLQSAPARYVVMLDPGHGGIDPGSVGPQGLQEKHLTLDIARRAALFLSEISEIEVRLTRDDDTGMARHERVAKVRQSEADLIVSLHLNQLPQSDVTLTETYYAGPQNLRGAAVSSAFVQASVGGLTGNRTNRQASQPDEFAFIEDSARIANILQKSVFNEVGYDNPGAVDAGVKRRTLYVLSQSVTPGVLVELTCLSNPREEGRLATEAYRNRLAAALADGIRAYFAETDPLLKVDNSI